jgi:hypothetical protein
MMTSRRTATAVAVAVLGAATSVHAALTMTPIWHVDPGTRSYMPAQSATVLTNTERGIAYNPATDHVLVVSRATNASTTPASLQIGIVSAVDGSHVGTLPTDSTINNTGITGTTFLLNKIAVNPSDGSIYAANLSTTTGTTGALKVYRWANETAAPTLVFNGSTAIPNSSPAVNGRFGDTMDLRVLPNGTVQMIFGRGSTGTDVLFAQSTDGTTFTSKIIPVSGAASLDFAHGITFAEGNTFYGKQVGGTTNMRRVAFDYDATTASVLNSYPTTDFSSSIGALDVEPNQHFLAALWNGTSNKVSVFDISDKSAQLLSANPYAEGSMNYAGSTLYANGNNTGQVVFGADPWTLYALQTNNSLFAFSVPEPTTLGLLALATPTLLTRRRRPN